MSILTKPWLDDGKAFDQAPGDGGDSLKTKRLGLFVFIGVATALFSLFATAYYMRMMLGGWQILGEPWILWPNTAVLLIGSVLMHWATRLGRRGDMVRARRMFMAGGVAGIVFLLGQIVAWQQLIELGAYARVNPANAFFYLITGLHGLHLFGGLVAWGRGLRKSASGAAADKVTASMELCGTYWHFMLLVWLGLFLLLLVT